MYSESKQQVQFCDIYLIGCYVFIILFYYSDSRVSAAEDEEGAAHRDGRSLLFDGEFRQPLRAGP